MKTYAGIDLHSSNSFIGVINHKNERLHSRRYDNNLRTVLKVLRKYKRSLQGVVVESTYNWYWLVDGLMENGYKVHLANPAAIQQYKGLNTGMTKWTPLAGAPAAVGHPGSRLHLSEEATPHTGHVPKTDAFRKAARPHIFSASKA